MSWTNPFGPSLFRFLDDLAQNNRRDWFEENKSCYEHDVLDPSLQFIADFAAPLRKISPHFPAIPKRVGGSLFRIYRDTRFSKDKSPYKTHVGIQFRHESHRDAHAPGFYLHIAPEQSFVGVGMWRPESSALRAIRERLAADPKAWNRAVGKRFQQRLSLAGDRLKRPPRDFDPEHPLIEEIKRKDFIGSTELTQKRFLAPTFRDDLAAIYRAGAPLVRFLCEAVDVPF